MADSQEFILGTISQGIADLKDDTKEVKANLSVLTAIVKTQGEDIAGIKATCTERAGCTPGTSKKAITLSAGLGAGVMALVDFLIQRISRG